MIKSKKQIFLVIGVFVLVMLLGTVTYAFFNYTRTGVSNTIKVGRISFVTRQTETINLTNVFPISSSEATGENPNYGEVVIEIVGDTDYSGGIEYLVSAVDANVYTTEGQLVPISLDVRIDDDLGTENNNYFSARDNTNTSIYKKIVGDTLVGDQMLLVGYIAPNSVSGTPDGIDATISIKAYLDKDKILISDTYDGTESDNMGTTNSMAQGKTVLTTPEWNALQQNGVSFKVKVEANEGIWVNGSLEEIMKKDAVMDNVSSTYVSASSGIDFGAISSDTNGKGVYMRAGTENDAYPIMYYRGAVEDNNVIFNNKCWKAVRTTDTGGVKLIYNGETSDVTEIGDVLAESKYTNIQSPVRLYTYDSSDNSWNITITDNSHPEFLFFVPSGDNYTMVVTGTTGSSTGGTYYFYKNNTSVSSGSAGGGSPISSSYAYGSLTSSDKIRFIYGGSSSVTSPITIKIQMQQNSTPISESSYNLSDKSFTFDSNSKKWSSTVTVPESTSIIFSVQEAGTYYLTYNNPNQGTFKISRNGEELLTSTGTQITKLLDLSPSDKIRVDYVHYNPTSNATVDFYLSNSLVVGFGCDNLDHVTGISLEENSVSTNKFSFNNRFSPSYSGYMYGNEYNTVITNTSSWVTGARFASDFTWDGSSYKLTGETVASADESHHYSCNKTNANDTCTQLRYVLYSYNGNISYLDLSNGDNIDVALEKMRLNINDSIAKSKIDLWYANNMSTYTNRIEDTIYCNDRRMNSNESDSEYYNNGWKSNGGELTNLLYYSGYDRVYQSKNPILSCDKNDSFTVNNSLGNHALTYPVGLITIDETMLAGLGTQNNSSSYLSSSIEYWTMTPYRFDNNYATHYLVTERTTWATITGNYMLRPVISIKQGQLIARGTGTAQDPYVIE